MQIDWLGKGRKISGLIAASFYIACTFCKIEKSFIQISKVLKVSKETIRKRVEEFTNLKVAQLSIEEFQNLSKTQHHFEPEDPPSFKRNELLALKNQSSNSESSKISGKA